MSKRILIFGATGRTGHEVINYALEKGYHVVALVRNPDKLHINSEQVTLIKGLPTNIEDVRAAMKGCYAVISLLSALPEKESFSFKRITPPHTLEKSLSNAITTMKEYNIKRVMILSSIGAGNSYQYAPWYMRLIIKITNFKFVFADHNAQEKLLENADLNWTIARPVALNNNETMGKLTINYSSTPKPFKISRKQLARFFVDNLDTITFEHKAPILSEI
ncbi:NAD(P)H-binding protein [Chitinophaga oryziterrae]|uniref:NAD(P)H-binding protein n=1 Tax=Chitinophaga oryziterrae TaxID=1031224 RepID=A0A6N8J6X8_9BACT|nr:NAD(P)-binding oxidoreductase [Chitinophaga oryziterrae]MVT40026.1 NAD(P)H-binding protein [Chitinophaga oryziterrae]